MSAGVAMPVADQQSDLGTRLAAGLAALDIEVIGPAQTRLVAYLRSLAKWNAVFNLTAVRAIDDMLPVHLLDSLAVLPLLDAWDSASLLDVGSGAGLPGIPIAVARPRILVTTVDAVAKKISFQQQVKGELRIENLTAIHRRVEALTLDQSPDIIISRAYSAISDMLTSIDHLADAHTRVVAMKGVAPTAELAVLPSGWRVEELRPLDVPALGAQRCAVVLRRRG